MLQGLLEVNRDQMELNLHVVLFHESEIWKNPVSFNLHVILSNHINIILIWKCSSRDDYILCDSTWNSSPPPHPLMHVGLKSLLQQPSGGRLTHFSPSLFSTWLVCLILSLSVVCHLLHAKLLMLNNPPGVMFHTWGQWVPGHLQLVRSSSFTLYSCTSCFPFFSAEQRVFSP